MPHLIATLATFCRHTRGPLAGLALLALCGPLAAVDGGYDPSFAQGGRRLIGVSGEDELVGVHLKPDRRLLMAGTCDGISSGATVVPTLCAAEIDANGAFISYGPTPSTTEPGTVIMTDLMAQAAGEKYLAGDSAIDASGRLLFAARREAPGSFRASVFRFSADGAQLAGQYQRPLGVGEQDESAFQAIIVDALGRIVVAGYVRRIGGRTSLALTRLNADLSPDSSFGTQGSVRVDSATADLEARDIEIDSNGRLLVLANVGDLNLSDILVGVYRFDANGALDSSFGNAGSVRVAGTADARAGGLAIDASDRPVVLGINHDIFEFDFDLFVARFNTNGTRDNSFNPIPGLGGGFLLIEVENVLGFGSNESAGDLLVQANGKIVLVGSAERADFSGTWFYTMRLLNNGDSDPAYGVNGVSVGSYQGAPFTGRSDIGKALNFDPAGYLLVGGPGLPDDFFGTQEFGIARLGNVEVRSPLLFGNGFE
ncbi:MAG: delta-60 repeat domain-containing protein [Lysobacterales bacterium]